MDGTAYTVKQVELARLNVNAAVAVGKAPAQRFIAPALTEIDGVHIDLDLAGLARVTGEPVELFPRADS